jgi:hypothetical protein
VFGPPELPESFPPLLAAPESSDEEDPVPSIS